jgi:hypothetical protein
LDEAAGSENEREWNTKQKENQREWNTKTKREDAIVDDIQRRKKKKEKER